MLACCVRNLNSLQLPSPFCTKALLRLCRLHKQVQGQQERLRQNSHDRMTIEKTL